MCGKCNKRSECTELCEKAEEYANKDYTPCREFISGKVPDPKRGTRYIKWPEINKSNTRLIYEMHFLDGEGSTYISQYINMPKSTIYDVINRFKENIYTMSKSEQNILNKHFVEYEDKLINIANLLDIPVSYVSETIEKYINHIIHIRTNQI